jgi:hypothetical protein
MMENDLTPKEQRTWYQLRGLIGDVEGLTEEGKDLAVERGWDPDDPDTPLKVAAVIAAELSP